jgi:hypothetical protein
MSSSFYRALSSAAPDPERELALYAFLVGDWTFDACVWLPDGGVHAGEGEIHAGWVLGGRALQDVWILPGIFHGTTLRIPDAARDGWHIFWSDPLHHYYGRQLGRAVGPDIVQLGRDDAGQATRWSFSERTPDRFTWRGETADDAAGPWRLVAEFHCRRVPA